MKVNFDKLPDFDFIVSPNEFDEIMEVAEEIPSCIRWPNTHHITIRVDSDTQMEGADFEAPSK